MRGLFLDRIWFLTLDDPLQDNGDHAILTSVLSAVAVPYQADFVKVRGSG